MTARLFDWRIDPVRDERLARKRAAYHTRQYRDPQDVCDRELADTLEAERARWARKKAHRV